MKVDEQLKCKDCACENVCGITHTPKDKACEFYKAEAVTELEKIRAEVGEPNEMEYFENSNVWQKWFCNLIDKHIKELKGE